MGRAVKGLTKVKKEVTTNKLKNVSISKHPKKNQGGLKTFVKNLKETTKGPVKAVDVLNNVEAILPKTPTDLKEPIAIIKINQKQEQPVKRISKKNKIRNKHINFMNKIEDIKKANEETVKRKKREKTHITGDLVPLKDSLPSLDNLLKYKEKGIQKTGVPKFEKQKLSAGGNKRNKLKNKKTNYGDRLKHLNLLITDKEFKSNPRQVITEHIRNTRLMEEAAAATAH